VTFSPVKIFINILNGPVYFLTHPGPPLLRFVLTMKKLLCVSLIVSSTEVCDPKRINQHRVFAVDARRGNTSMGWFDGFKLHLALSMTREIYSHVVSLQATSMTANLFPLMAFAYPKLTLDR
jgi:hypothetical protein